ncbi:MULTISPECIES: gene transfer agent family protein [unclassified Aureimonas]|uniref:gene transfer agent family protein n=1 Tax=unclassified Aureimonas TaxID=2615206 RepID=UPI0006FCB858|nr:MULTISPECIES: gene transfer agent family protein [unclassified Aureimonas]KQT55386.1 transfer Agent [Aureimonas sp. Leaf427]KQT71062.1 transfer Agent [Aureimonas sp. Leaf460]
MAVNRRRGEVGAIIDGRERVLCLTLGALAELEDAFAAEDVSALLRRFGAGRLGARDLTRILGAGLRGAGETVTDADVSAMRIDGGAAGAATVAAELLAAAFGESAGAGGDAASNP